MENNIKIIGGIVLLAVFVLFMVSRSQEQFESPNFPNIPATIPQVDASLQAADKLQQAQQLQIPPPEGPKPFNATYNKLAPIKYNDNVLPYPQMSSTYESLDDSARKPVNPNQDIYNRPSDIINPLELLPRDDPYNNFNLSNPTVNGKLEDKNFLETAYNYGIDTVSNSLRYANHQLRSDPIISYQSGITPWNGSTIGPDLNRKQFEIGS